MRDGDWGSEGIDKESGYVERIPMLYLLSENIATYEHFVSSCLFQVRHGPATCEGLAFGGGKRSLIDELFDKFIETDQRASGIARTLVNLQDIFHRRYESGISIRRNTPPFDRGS